MTTLVLTLSCTDRVGIVAAITGVLAEAGAFITESQQFADLDMHRFFMRVAFSHDGETAAAMREALAPVAARFAMDWHLADTAEPMRVMLAVSRFGHCLNDLLHRWRTGTLPIAITAVVSTLR